MTGTRRSVIAAAIVAVAMVSSACGVEERPLAGYRRDPAPTVGDLSLPDLTAGGSEFALRAEPGGILAVYFGYTNCPDFCPTTLSDLRLATRRMDESVAERVGLAMITVDPDRDLPVLADYVSSFLAGAHALGTSDAGRLAEVAAPFGASYQVSSGDDGIEVAHSTSLYAVDDDGELVLTWQFGVPIDDLAADLEQLLEASGD